MYREKKAKHSYNPCSIKSYWKINQSCDTNTNKHINRDLKLTVDWIRANKLSLNASKTEIVLFKPRNEKITKHLTDQKIKQSSKVRYLGVIL